MPLTTNIPPRKTTIRKQLLSIVPGPLSTLIRYIYKHRRFPRLRNPHTFSDKILHRMLHDRRPTLQIFSDKLAVRDYVLARVSDRCLPNLYHVTDDPKSIPFAKLPRQFVVKGSHGSNWTYIIGDKLSLSVDDVISHCTLWLSRNYYDYGGEWSYKHISPKIIIEELLLDENNDLPSDYKFFCFDGKVSIVQVDVDRFTDHRRSLYSRTWEELPVQYIYQRIGTRITKPKNFSDMIGLAEQLSAGIDFARVDLYNIDGNIYFGEITNYPESGVGRFVPRSFDDELGRQWAINHGC